MKFLHFRLSLIVLALLFLLSGCSGSNLNNLLKGNSDQDKKSDQSRVEAMLIGAYSMLSYPSWQIGWESASSNYVFADIRGMVGNKGAYPDVLPEINPIQNFSETPLNSYLNDKWMECYDAIAKCNNVIDAVKSALNARTISKDQATLYLQQARALRGWFHFEAWRMWGKIPYIDENTSPSDISNIPDIRQKIIEDLADGAHLPNNMGALGKFNGTVCQVLLARAKMQMFHDYQGALTFLNEAKNGSKPDGSAIGLAPTYGEIFDIANRNGIESVFSIQYSVNDGTGSFDGVNVGKAQGNDENSRVLAGSRMFFQPTQEYVNSFRTSGGLPLLDDSYNDQPVKNDQGVAADSPFNPDQGPLDPRIDWCVGRRGIPFLDWGKHKGAAWIKDQAYAGPWSSKKQFYRKSQEGQIMEMGNWTTGYTINVYHMIRYADILLLIAECQIETGDLDGALRNINLVRARAANPAGFVTEEGHPAANYQISLYQVFPDAEYARKALRMERKLELGMEGQRWFDLNRWGITEKELSRIMAYEKRMPWGKSLYGSASINSNVTTYPLPQSQVALSGGRISGNR